MSADGPVGVEYDIERILEKRVNEGTGKVEYLIKWEDYGMDECTWEPEENLKSGKKNVIKEFETRHLKYGHITSKSIPEVGEHHLGGVVYPVESVLNKRLNPRTNKIEYLLKWEGYDISDSTWEPEEHVLCVGLLEEFNNRRDQ